VITGEYSVSNWASRTELETTEEKNTRSTPTAPGSVFEYDKVESKIVTYGTHKSQCTKPRLLILKVD
jgi:hypothetical protein